MAFRFYLDGQLTDQPMNDTDLSTSVKRDNRLNNLTITQDVELEYNANNLLNPGEISGYQYLYDKFFATGCAEVNVEIYDQVDNTTTVLVYKGIIKVPSIKIDLQRFVLRTKIQDNGYYSYINNNRSIPVLLTGQKTKNGNDITQLSKYDVDLYNSINGTSVGTRQGLKIYDCFDFLIRAISDNQLTFQSSFLSNLTEVPFLFTWGSLRNVLNFDSYTVTFETLFDELNKIYSLFYYIDESNPNNPIFRIENYDSSFNGAPGISFTDIKELDVSYQLENYFSDIDVGSEFVTVGSVANYPFTDFLGYNGWDIKNIFPRGQCNTNNKLDLVNEFVIHSNSIQDVVVMATTEYQSALFLIACDNVDDINFTASAIKYDPYGVGDSFYNIVFNNFNKLQRHSSRFTTDLGTFLASGGDNFRALMGYSSATQRVYQGLGSAFTGNLMQFTSNQFFYSGNVNLGAVNETQGGGFDSGGNYNNSTPFEYTAPLEGNYSFNFQLVFEINGIVGTPGYNERFELEMYFNPVVSSGGYFTNTFFIQTYYINGIFTQNLSGVAYLYPGDTVKASYNIYFKNNIGTTDPTQQIARNLIIKWDSFFECTASPDGGVIPYAGDLNVRKYIYEFDYDINQTDFLALKPVITGPIEFEKDGKTNIGWVESMKRNDWTGMTTIKLITNNASITQ